VVGLGPVITSFFGALDLAPAALSTLSIFMLGLAGDPFFTGFLGIWASFSIYFRLSEIRL
jgi:NADH:ubiquinone oxidoreductase subunit 2 (subunit N)